MDSAPTTTDHSFGLERRLKCATLNRAVMCMHHG
jgi:hypothetical protein